MLTKWDRRFLDLLHNEVRNWSKDPSTKVGAAIVRPDLTIASLGYNGFARGVRDDEERYLDREFKYKLVVHAEENAIVHATENLSGYTLYTTPLSPCSKCAGLIIQSGITRVVSYIISKRVNDESHEIARLQFKEAGVELIEEVIK